jgi:ferredoxin
MGQPQWHVAVDRDKCIGSGMCTGTAPGHFRLEDHRSRPVDETIEPDEAVLDAAQTCPMEAITVLDHAGTQLAPEP